MNKFRLFMFVYWAMMLSVSGMYTMYLVEVGFSKVEIGFTVTLFTFSALIGQNFIGYLADRFGAIKKILLACISIGILLAFTLSLSRNHLYINVMIALWGFFLYGTVPLNEAWCIRFLRTTGDQNNFGKIRGFGSIGYGLSGVLLGFLLENAGWKLYYWYILVGVCFTLVTIFLMSEGKRTSLHEPEDAKEEVRPVSFREGLTEILHNKALRSVVLIVFMYSFVVKGIYSYLGVLVSDFGGGPLSLGFTYFFDASPEIVTFFLTARLMSRFQSKNLIYAAFILQVIRLSLILVFDNSLAIILLGCLSGFAYGMLASAYKTYIYELAPEKFKISCLSLSESIIGMAGVISAPVFGFLITFFGGHTSILIGLAIDLAVLLFLSKDLIKKYFSVNSLW